MSTRTRTRRRAVIIAAVVLAVVAIVWALARGGDTPTLTGPYVPPSDRPTGVAPSPTLDPSPDVAPGAPGGIPDMSAMPTAGVPGLQGDGWTKQGGRHRVRISISSDAPMVFAGYRVPTARASDSAKAVSSFGATVTAWGYPDYAQAFVTSGPASRHTECTITVDGKVTEHRVAEGPYAYLFCQG